MSSTPYDFKVSDVIELLYRIQVREFEEHFKKVKEHKGKLIWASALTRCPRKWLYMLRFPEIVQAEFRGVFVLGRMAHIGLQQLLREYYMALDYDKVETEVEVEKRIVLEGEGEILLVGKADAVAYKDDEKIVYEIKTARSDIGIPHEHHLLQLRIYMNLVESSKGILLYLTPDRVAEYSVDEAISDEELESMVREFLKFNGPKYEWECGYCQYSSICPFKRTAGGRR